jgi:hypothetical protein
LVFVISNWFILWSFGIFWYVVPRRIWQPCFQPSFYAFGSHYLSADNAAWQATRSLGSDVFRAGRPDEFVKKSPKLWPNPLKTNTQLLPKKITVRQN